jgi:GT2 family glycosyltransferase
MTSVDVLIGTCERPAALAVTLTSLFAQDHPHLRIVIADQGEVRRVDQAPEVNAIVSLLRAKGHEVEIHCHLPPRGLAEQRHFLLDQARAPYVLFLDDDVVLEPQIVGRLLKAIREQGCGFVGSAPIDMSHAAKPPSPPPRVEFWEGRVEPEVVLPDTSAWDRHQLHCAANLYHVQKRLGLRADEQRLYRVAWVGGCVLFDAAKLRAVGGFDFWDELPPEHRDEDVYVQLHVMARDGGCAVMPSGAYHQERPAAIRRRKIDVPYLLRGKSTIN